MGSMMRNCYNIFIMGIWLILWVGLVRAQEGSSQFLENAPQSYVVRQGDTLWSIANQYLRDPWDWPLLWDANPNIQNPNCIYPGDEIVLSYVEGKPKLKLRFGKSKNQNTRHSGMVKLHPQIRVYPADRPIPTIPLQVIGPFLNESRVVTKKEADHCPKVIALDEDHIVVGTGDRFYVSGLSKKPNNMVYDVFRPNKTYLSPKTKMPIGIEGLVLGKAEVEVLGEPARLLINKSFAEIKVGDRIIITATQELDPYFIPKFPKTQAQGQIISVFGGLNQIGQYQVLVVTGGLDKEREVGDVLDIYQTNKDIPSRLVEDESYRYRFPPFKIGRCVVFRVFDQVSYVLVMKAIRPIYLLDEVWRP